MSQRQRSGVPASPRSPAAHQAAPGAALRAARTALDGARAWLVGGAVRDRALERRTIDLDLVIDGDPARAARAIARAAGDAACFELSDEFDGWRVVARDRAWQVDVQPLRGGSLVADLALRDLTVNAIAEPLGEAGGGAAGAGGDRGGGGAGPAIDPFGGLTDLAAGRLRMVSDSAFRDDPLRVLRLVRQALELEFAIDQDTARAAAAAAPGLRLVAGERVFAELRRIVGSPRALAGLALLSELAITPVALPELDALRGVEQSRYHHLDVYGHTLEVLEHTIALQAGAGAVLGAPELAGPVAALLAEPLADELTRGEALRWGALLHDAAKPLTRACGPDGAGVTFFGHDERGAELARAVLARLRTSERLRAHVAALVRHHLRLGFLVHAPRPLARRTVFDYLQATAPVEVDVTLLSIADRLSTRGDRATEAIAAHMALARAMLIDALRFRADGPPAPLWRGDRLASALGIAEGPQLGAVLRELSAAQYAGELATPAQALEHARAFLAAGG